MAWTNLDPTTSTFTVNSMIPGYKDGGSRQYMEKVVNNTGWNYNQVVARWEEKGRSWYNGIPAGGEIDFATGQEFRVDSFAFWEEIQNETVFVDLLDVNYEPFFANFEIKALATGGFRIHNTSGILISVDLVFIKIKNYGQGTLVP